MPSFPERGKVGMKRSLVLVCVLVWCSAHLVPGVGAAAPRALHAKGRIQHVDRGMDAFTVGTVRVEFDQPLVLGADTTHNIPRLPVQDVDMRADIRTEFPFAVEQLMGAVRLSCMNNSIQLDTVIPGIVPRDRSSPPPPARRLDAESPTTMRDVLAKGAHDAQQGRKYAHKPRPTSMADHLQQLGSSSPFRGIKLSSRYRNVTTSAARRRRRRRRLEAGGTGVASNAPRFRPAVPLQWESPSEEMESRFGDLPVVYVGSPDSPVIGWKISDGTEVMDFSDEGRNWAHDKDMCFGINSDIMDQVDAVRELEGWVAIDAYRIIDGEPTPVFLPHHAFRFPGPGLACTVLSGPIGVEVGLMVRVWADNAPEAFPFNIDLNHPVTDHHESNYFASIGVVPVGEALPNPGQPAFLPLTHLLSATADAYVPNRDWWVRAWGESGRTTPVGYLITEPHIATIAPGGCIAISFPFSTDQEDFDTLMPSIATVMRGPDSDSNPWFYLRDESVLEPFFFQSTPGELCLPNGFNTTGNGEAVAIALVWHRGIFDHYNGKGFVFDPELAEHQGPYPPNMQFVTSGRTSIIQAFLTSNPDFIKLQPLTPADMDPRRPWMYNLRDRDDPSVKVGRVITAPYRFNIDREYYEHGLFTACMDIEDFDPFINEPSNVTFPVLAVGGRNSLFYPIASSSFNLQIFTDSLCVTFDVERVRTVAGDRDVSLVVGYGRGLFVPGSDTPMDFSPLQYPDAHEIGSNVPAEPTFPFTVINPSNSSQVIGQLLSSLELWDASVRDGDEAICFDAGMEGYVAMEAFQAIEVVMSVWPEELSPLVTPDDVELQFETEEEFLNAFRFVPMGTMHLVDLSEQPCIPVHNFPHLPLPQDVPFSVLGIAIVALPDNKPLPALAVECGESCHPTDPKGPESGSGPQHGGGEGEGGGGGGGGGDGAPITFALPTPATYSPMSTLFGSMGGLDVRQDAILPHYFDMAVVLEMRNPSMGGVLRGLLTPEEFMGTCEVRLDGSLRTLENAAGEPVDRTLRLPLQPADLECDWHKYIAQKEVLLGRIENMGGGRDFEDMDVATWAVTAAAVHTDITSCHDKFWSLLEHSETNGTRFHRHCTEQPWVRDNTGQEFENAAFWEDPCCNDALLQTQCCRVRPVATAKQQWTITTATPELVGDMCGVSTNLALPILREASEQFSRDGFGMGSTCTLELDTMFSPQTWSTLASFRHTCNELIFNQRCKKNEDCYSQRCDTIEGKCRMAWSDPEQRARATAACFSDPNTDIDKDVLVGMKQYLGVKDLSSKAEFTTKLTELFLGGEGCSGPSAHEHQGRMERIPDPECDQENNERCHEEWEWVQGSQEDCLAVQSCNWDRWNVHTEAECLGVSGGGSGMDQVCMECFTPLECWGMTREPTCGVHNYYDQLECEEAGFTWDSRRSQCVKGGITDREECLPATTCPWSHMSTHPILGNLTRTGDNKLPEDSDWCGASCYDTAADNAADCYALNRQPVWSDNFGACVMVSTKDQCASPWTWVEDAELFSVYFPNTTELDGAESKEAFCETLFPGDSAYHTDADTCYLRLVDTRASSAACEHINGYVSEVAGMDIVFGVVVESPELPCVGRNPTNPTPTAVNCASIPTPASGAFVERSVLVDGSGTRQTRCVFEDQIVVTACDQVGGDSTWDASLGICRSSTSMHTREAISNHPHEPSLLSTGVCVNRAFGYDDDRKRCDDHVLQLTGGAHHGLWMVGAGCTVDFDGLRRADCTADGGVFDSKAQQCVLGKTQRGAKSKFKSGKRECVRLSRTVNHPSIANIRSRHAPDGGMQCVIEFTDPPNADMLCSELVGWSASFTPVMIQGSCIASPTESAHLDTMGCGEANTAGGSTAFSQGRCVKNVGGPGAVMVNVCNAIAPQGAYWASDIQQCVVMVESRSHETAQACYNIQEQRETWWWHSPIDSSRWPEAWAQEGQCVSGDVYDAAGCNAIIASRGPGGTVEWFEGRWWDGGDLAKQESCETPSCDVWDNRGKRLQGDACTASGVGYCTTSCKRCMSKTRWEWGMCFGGLHNMTSQECENVGGTISETLSGLCVVEQDREHCPSGTTWHACVDMNMADPECASSPSSTPGVEVPPWAIHLECFPNYHGWCHDQGECEQEHNGECSDWDFMDWEASNEANNYQPTRGGCLIPFMAQPYGGLGCDWGQGWRWSRRGCIKRNTDEEACASVTDQQGAPATWVPKADSQPQCEGSEGHGSGCRLPRLYSLIARPEQECRECFGKPEPYYHWRAAQWVPPPMRTFTWGNKTWGPENAWVRIMNESAVDDMVQSAVASKFQRAVQNAYRCSHTRMTSYVDSFMCLCGDVPGTKCDGVPNPILLAQAQISPDSPTIVESASSDYLIPEGSVEEETVFSVTSVPHTDAAPVTGTTESRRRRRLEEGAPTPDPVLPQDVVEFGVVRNADGFIVGDVVTDVTRYNASTAIAGNMTMCMATLLTPEQLTAWPDTETTDLLTQHFVAYLSAESVLTPLPNHPEDVAVEGGRLCYTGVIQPDRNMAVVRVVQNWPSFEVGPSEEPSEEPSDDPPQELATASMVGDWELATDGTMSFPFTITTSLTNAEANQFYGMEVELVAQDESGFAKRVLLEFGPETVRSLVLADPLQSLPAGGLVDFIEGSGAGSATSNWQLPPHGTILEVWVRVLAKGSNTATFMKMLTVDNPSSVAAGPDALVVTSPSNGGTVTLPFSFAWESHENFASGTITMRAGSVTNVVNMDPSTMDNIVFAISPQAFALSNAYATVVGEYVPPNSPTVSLEMVVALTPSGELRTTRTVTLDTATEPPYFELYASTIQGWPLRFTLGTPEVRTAGSLRVSVSKVGSTHNTFSIVMDDAHFTTNEAVTIPDPSGQEMTVKVSSFTGNERVLTPGDYILTAMYRDHLNNPPGETTRHLTVAGPNVTIDVMAGTPPAPPSNNDFPTWLIILLAAVGVLIASAAIAVVVFWGNMKSALTIAAARRKKQQDKARDSEVQRLVASRQTQQGAVSKKTSMWPLFAVFGLSRRKRDQPSVSSFDYVA